MCLAVNLYYARPIDYSPMHALFGRGSRSDKRWLVGEAWMDCLVLVDLHGVGILLRFRWVTIFGEPGAETKSFDISIAV